MKNLISNLSCAFMLCCSVPSMAQFGIEFAPVGASWRYNAYTYNFDTGSRQYRYEVVGDTVMAGLNARKITGSYWQTGYGDFVADPNHPIFVATDGDKVLIWGHSSQHFLPLYDFGAQPGDTLTGYAAGAVPLCAPDSFSYLDELRFDYIVDSVGVTSVNGLTLRTQSVRTVEVFDLNWTFGHPSSGWNIVERMGNVVTASWFGEAAYIITAGEPAHFRCYQDPLITYNPTGYTCDYVNSVSDALAANWVMAPNPFLEEITITAPEALAGEEVVFTLYRADGTAVKSTVVPGGSGNVSLAGLPSGVYFGVITCAGKRYAAQRLIRTADR